MRLRVFGYDVRVRKAAPPATLSSVPGSGWRNIAGLFIGDHYPGAWQRDDEWTPDTVLAHHAVYACVTLIASDVAKLRPKLMEQDQNGIWTETKSAAFSPVLRKPNRYQTRIQFFEAWMTSKLLRGNAYIYLDYNERDTVRAMYVLDPSRVQPLVAPDGSVFYKLSDDNLSGIGEQTVPADWIIHDRMNCLFHPLVGTSPIYASGAAANVGLNIERSAARFHANDRTPSGVLTAPGTITQPQADQLRAQWQARTRGQIAVLGNGLTFQPMTMTAEDSQTIEQLRWTGEVVCSAFHVPPFKIGIGAAPAGNSETLDLRYYSDCLQSHIEHMELLLDEALGLTEPKQGTLYGVEFDLDGLLRMDTATQVTTLTTGIRGGLFTPNGARAKMDLSPLEGGDTIYLQHQDYPMEMVFNRADLSAPPPTPPPPADEPDPEEPDTEDDDAPDEETERAWLDLFEKAIAA